jgi:hypothetical protein
VEAAAGVDDLAAIARAADRAAFWYIAVCDHIAIPKPLDEKMSTSWWDTVATLGYLAAITEQVRLMSHVYVLPYRHPLMAAKSFLTLDELSGGRAILGVGAGHVESEFELLGVDFASRGRALDEASMSCGRPSPRSTPRSTRRRSTSPTPGCAARRPGRRPADLGRRIVEAGAAPGRRQGRRVAAAGPPTAG